MKKFLFAIFFILSTNSFAAEVKMNFTKDAFESAQKSGKTVVVNSWNKWCYTCIKQEKIFKQARNDFKNVLFFQVKCLLAYTSLSTINLNPSSKI